MPRTPCNLMCTIVTLEHHSCRVQFCQLYTRPTPEEQITRRWTIVELATDMMKRSLTREQEELRLRGLRILARMIVRYHLTVTARNGQGNASIRANESGVETGTLLDMQEEGNDG